MPSDDTAVESTTEPAQSGDDTAKDLTASNLDMAWTLVPLRKERSKDEEAVRRILSGKTAWETIKLDMDRKSHGFADSRKGSSAHEHPERRPSNSRSDFEQDFTTPGVEGTLRCPFAHITGGKPGSHPSSGPHASTVRQAGKLPTPPHRRGSHSLIDPIEAEFHGDTISSPPPSATGSASKCPIRFLDQHSPEEVAKYFENHKHEIPRSHEICVKRYQSNAESIRQLDAKYGSLVSMIQGLGMKHQPLLPAADEVDILDGEVAPADRVGKWAEAISERLEGREDGSVEQEQEDREGHFDRPLKEIRVGESPSRPWGISVPVTGDPVVTPFSSRGDRRVDEHQSGNERLPGSTSNKGTGRCPFGFDKKELSQQPGTQSPRLVVPNHAASSSQERPQLESKSGQQQLPPASQMVFTGPVFIGYAPEQAMAFVQQLGIGAKPSI